MQIRNDFNSYSGTEYQRSHAHHITKCLHEEEHKKMEGAAAGVRNDTRSSGKTEEKNEQEAVLSQEENSVKRTGGLKRGLGMVKSFWDAMGDERQDNEENPLAAKNGPDGTEGVEAASSAIRQGLSYHILNKWESVREKIKAGISTALKHFGKGNDAFGALTDLGGRFTGKKESEKKQPSKAERGTRQNNAEFLTAESADSHLMDSYSKTGEYCRLNENLTYRKNKPANGE